MSTTSRRPMGDVTNESRLAKPTSLTDRKRERSTRENSDVNAPSQKTRKLDSTSRPSTTTSSRPSSISSRVSSVSSRPSSTSSRVSSVSSRPSSTSSRVSSVSSRPSSTSSRPSSVSSRPSLSRPSSASTSSRVSSSSSSRTTSSRPATTSTSSRVSSTSSRSASTTSSRSSSSSSSASALAGSRPGKRAAWDTKGRLADLEELQKSMKHKIRENDDRVVLLEELLKEKETTVSSLSSDKEDLKGNLEMYQTRINEETQAKQRFMFELENAKVRHSSEIQEKVMKIGSLETEVQSLKVQIQVHDSENSRLRTQNTTQTMEMERNKKDYAMKETKFEADIASLKGHVADEEQKNAEKAAKIDELEAFIAEQKEKIAELEERQRNDEHLRRKLHNAIQELKGNIRVFCRVRPLSSKEKKMIEGGGASGGDQGGALAFNRADPRNLEVVSSGSTSVSGKSLPDKRHPFSFDKVFSPESDQEDVFLEISQLVQSSLDGYNTCIFAYGQTGSGKTFTMEGPNSPTEVTEGMIPRTVKQIFRTAKELESLGWQYEFHCQFLEIYNESLRDLLSANQKEEKEGGAPKHEIKHSRDGMTSVTDVTVVKVESPHQVRQLLKRASKNRSVGSTEKNDRSSRSHSVFQIKISGRNTISGKTAKAALSLIDLAGSERLSTSGAEGQRKKETQYINKSLSSLGDVICALANKEGHIPFRNSKLTYLLQNSLGGNSKTLMFVNVSPAVADTQESISSLRFATKVNACEIGVARRGGKIDLKLD